MSGRRVKVALLVHGSAESAMGERARSLVRGCGAADRFDVRIEYRTGSKIASVGRMLGMLRDWGPDVIYVLDMGVSGVAAGLLRRSTAARTKVVVDTGDAIYELARSSGMRGMFGLAATDALEEAGLLAADGIVVRGTRHRELVAARGLEATVIQDGVWPEDWSAAAGEASTVRSTLGLPDDALVVGLVGSSVWSERLGMAYGWDLVELLALLPPCVRAAGLLVGDGTGVARLSTRAEALGVRDRMRFVGRVPFARLRAYVAAMDVCLSTQTNDIPGNVRTTGKLPIYLASGRFVLASDVGEASLVLPRAMRVRYNGTSDPAYPTRLAERIEAIVADRSILQEAEAGPELARRHFDYRRLGRRWAGVIEVVLAP